MFLETNGPGAIFIRSFPWCSPSSITSIVLTVFYSANETMPYTAEAQAASTGIVGPVHTAK